MKKLSSFLFFLFPLMVLAQSVAINNDNSLPDNSALLDLKSNNKGLLIPRLTTLERTSIMGPALGLTVFDVTTYSYWMYRGDINGGWTELMHSYQKHWDANGTNVFNTNTGNIGIGTSAPAEKLSINASNPTIQFLNSGSAKGFLQANSNDIRIGTYFNNTTGNLVFGTRASDRVWITPAGEMGIGTSNPGSVLTVNGANPILQLRNAEVDKGFVQIVNDDIKIGTNAGNTGKFIIRTNGGDRLHVNENGWVAIGTTLQNSTLQVNGDGTNAAFRVQVNGSSKMIVTPNGGVSIGANQFNPPDNGLYVAGMTAIATTTPTAEFTINSLVTNQHPRLEMRYNNTPVGQLETKQNALLDVALTCTNPTGRAIISANANPFGVVVQPVSGQVSIGGTRKATFYNLCVNGQVICTELTINNDMDNWPDYVFEDNYKLMSLSEVKKYINANKHLPNIPSAAEIGKKGIEVGDMNKRLMEKIEELTLYIIQLQEQVDELKKKQAVQSGTN